ncbi:hypothetical protein [Streptomyces sp. NPDC004134]|uniref:hypothetical protein n=1 Tax=Streptomyces sp. NPDC004134 TaxID=3364691 RepID=UPI00368D2B2F
MGQRGLRRGIAALCAGAALLGAAGCSEPDGWQDGEVREEAAAGACDDVSDETLALLRIEPPKTGACTWATDPSRQTGQRLLVRVTAFSPDRGNDVTATEAAGAGFPPEAAKSVGGTAAGTVRDVPGLGAEAVTFRVDTTSYRLFVRQRNVVVSVLADTSGKFDDESAVTPAAAEDAVLRAAREVLDAAGVPLDGELPGAPEPGADEVPRAKPLCGVLRDQGARLVPGVEPSPESPAGDRIRRCHWSPAGDPARSRLFVGAEAFAPSALTARDGTAEARYAFEQPTFGGEPLAGLGDEAAVDAEAGNLYVRKDNLLVRVWYEAARPEGAKVAALESVARTVLAQYG